jgi:hypothetical protein
MGQPLTLSEVAGCEEAHFAGDKMRRDRHGLHLKLR